MASSLLSPVISAYRLALQPIPPFTWIGSPISAFDVVAAFRLCLALRQMRDAALAQHLFQQRQRRRVVDSSDNEKCAISEGEREGEDVEEYSLAKSIAAVLVTVYGGEAVMCPWLSIPPSFLSSPLVPSLYAFFTYLVDLLPASIVPTPSLSTELPLSFLDGLTRAFLLCQLIPPVVTMHASPDVAANPWTLLLSSMVIANTGFLTLNTLSMLHPSGFRLSSTPPELRAWGWTTTDLWCAPLTTGLYATLTHAQPFWEGVHGMVVGFLTSSASESAFGIGFGQSSTNGEEKLHTVSEAQVQALDPETACAACALLLTTLFVTRTSRNFGPAYLKSLGLVGWRGEKKKVVMRSRVDGKRYPGTAKKTQ